MNDPSDRVIDAEQELVGAARALIQEFGYSQEDVQFVLVAHGLGAEQPRIPWLRTRLRRSER